MAGSEKRARIGARISKDVALITSGGRTGTEFFGRQLGRIVSDCWSAHEPDVWQGPLDLNSWRAIGWFGFYHVTAGKLLRRSGMRCLMERYLGDDWDDEQTVASILRQRKAFYDRRPGSMIAESNSQWFGLLPLLPRVFSSYRVLAIVRDPRTWVRSRVNFGGHHDKQDRVGRLGLPRISPALVGDETAKAWAKMDTFERLCWDWWFVTSRLIDATNTDRRARLIRFEDIFKAEDGREKLEEALDFLTHFDDRRYPYRIPPALLKERINVSRPVRLGTWDEWPQKRRDFLMEMCGKLMEHLGYSRDG